MTPQERQALQQNAALRENLGAFGAPNSETAYIEPQVFQQPQTIQEGLDIMQRKMATAKPAGVDFSTLMKKYNVKDMIPSSLKGIMTQKSTPMPQPMRTMPAQPMFQQRGAQEAAGAISGALGDITQKMQVIRPTMMYERSPELNQQLRQYLSSQGRPVQLPQEGSKEYFDVVREMETARGAGGIFGEAGKEARKAAQEGQRLFTESAGEIDLGLRKLAQGDLTGLDQVFRKGIFQAVSGASQAVSSPIIGAISQAPEPVKQALGTAIQGVTNVVDGTLSTVGIDPNDMLGQNIKAGMLALMDVAPFLSGSKTIRAGAQGAVRGATQGGVKMLQGVNVMGKSGAQMLNNATKKLLANAKKTGGGAADVALDAASNTAFQTPAKYMKIAAKNGDDFVKTIDDVPGTEISLMENVAQTVDDVLSERGAIGAMYNPLRQSNQRVLFRKNWDAGVWDDLGIEIKNGIVVPKFGQMKNSKLSTSQIQQLNSKVGELLPKTGEKFNVDQLLKLKSKLDDVADWNSSANRADKPVMAAARDLYGKIDSIAKRDIRGLAGIDAKYTKISRELNALKKEFMTEDAYGNLTFKPSIQPETLTRLLSPTNRNKLQMLEQYIPDITNRLEVLDAAKNILAAGDLSTGKALGRFFTTTAATVTNPLIGVATFFLTDPVRASKFFARFGKLIGMSTETLDSARRAAQASASQVKKTAKETVKTPSNVPIGKKLPKPPVK